MTNADLIRQISELDDSQLSLDDLISIQSLLPTSTERAILETHVANALNDAAGPAHNAKPPHPLTPAEQFMIQTFRVRDISARLSAFVLKLQLPLEVEDLKTKLDMMRSVCSVLRDSEDLRHILRTVLQLGNLSNVEFGAGNSSYRPWMGKEARTLGFKVDGLARLKDVKSADGKWDLMNFLVDMVQQSHPEVLDFTLDFVELKKIRLFEMREMVKTLVELESSLQTSQSYRYLEDSTEPDREKLFMSRFGPFTEEAKIMLDTLREQFKSTAEDWEEAALYFGEDLEDYISVSEIIACDGIIAPPKPGVTKIRKQPSYLFNALGIFFQGFEDAVRQGRRLVEEEARQIKREAVAAEARRRREAATGKKEPVYARTPQPSTTHQQQPTKLSPPQPRHQPGAGVRAALAALSAAKASSVAQTRQAEAREMMQRFSMMPSLAPEDMAALADAADAAGGSEDEDDDDEDDVENGDEDWDEDGDSDTATDDSEA